MKGFVLHLQKAKDEDTIVLILSENEVRTYYRFYGARHSILQLGHLIDFEVEGEDGRFLPRLRSLSHIAFPWLYDRNRLLIWHNFIQLFKPHLQDTGELEPFYFELLLDAAKKWEKQNPKRIVCESYVKLLEYEGRIYDDQECIICQSPTRESVSLIRAFKPAHPGCVYGNTMEKEKLHAFFETHKTLYLDEDEVEMLYQVVMQGL